MKNVIFIAPPAAGKGTLSEYLTENYPYRHISTGNILRKQASLDTPMGKEIAKLLKAGEFITDEYIIEVLHEEFDSMKESEYIILDGFPRNSYQAKFLEEKFSDLDFVVVNIIVDENELEKRVTGRYNCPDCNKTYNKYFENLKPLHSNLCDECGKKLVQRTDDSVDKFKFRYDKYLSETLPVLDFYRGLGKLYEVDNSSSDLDKTYENLIEIVGVDND